MNKSSDLSGSGRRRHGLSKSKISAFEQCEKRLWLSVHEPDRAVTDEESKLRFAVGHEVGNIACSLYPEGEMVEALPNLSAALKRTETLISLDHRTPIFEATFEHEGVLVRVDILEPDPNGSWRIAEVKSSTKAKEYHLGDLATQVWVVRGAGLEISSAAIRHINNEFELTQYGQWDGLFRDAELLEAIQPVILERGEVVQRAREVLSSPSAPKISVGAHCQSPFPCEFAQFCGAGFEPGPKWPVTVLPGGGGRRWIEQGIEDIFEIDPSELKGGVHQRVYDATIHDRPFHDVEGARRAISEWGYPRSWLDFETIAFAVPRWIGTRPYQQIPFQFSVHIEQDNGSIEHNEFLDVSGEDPRLACATALLQALPPEGAIIAYNAGFERSCIKTLIAACPELASELNGLEARLVDLLPVTRANWYHRDQRGSWSIKAVLPTISGGSAYAELAVQSGVQAQAAYLEAISPEVAKARRDQIEDDLRTYCKLDTEAMIVLAKHLTASC